MNNNIRQIRIEKGMKLNELAKYTSLSVGYLSHLERGSRNNPSYKTMMKICDVLNKNLYEVFNKE